MSAVVSIIMPAFNAGKYIAEAIESVLAQTYRDWELIIVDDESQDDTKRIVGIFRAKDKRIKYHWQKNGKQGKARNKGLALSAGSYIAFLDADDIWLSDKLERQLRRITEQKSDLVFGYARLIEKNQKTERIIGRGRGRYEQRSAIEFLLHHDAFIMSTVLATRQAVARVGGFTESPLIQYCEDWHIWLNMALAGCSFYTDGEVVSYYRLHEQSVAAVEYKAQVKFFYALRDLHLRFPSETALGEQLRKRAYGLIYHEPDLNQELVDAILDFLQKEKQLRVSRAFLKFIFRIHVPMFRKFFLAISSKNNRQMTI